MALVLGTKNPSSGGGGSNSILGAQSYVTAGTPSYESSGNYGSAGGIPLVSTPGDVGGSPGGYGGYGAYSPPSISQNIPGPSGNLPNITYGPERETISPEGNQKLLSALSGAGGGGGGIPSLPPYQPPSLGGGGGSGGGVGRGLAIQGMLQQQRADAASRLQSEMTEWQYKQQRSQAAYDKKAVGRLGEGYESMLENYNRAFGEATAGNEARYQQLLGIADQTTGQRMADVSSAYNRQESDAMQRLAGLGMGNTTIAPTIRSGIERERQAALNRTADQMQQTKLGIIERRDDEYPDLGSLQAIIGGTGSAFGTRGIDAMLEAFGKVRSV